MSPERAAALHEVAEAVEHVGMSVDQLIDELRVARDKTHEELNHLRKLTWMILLGLLALCTMTVLVGYTLFLVNDTISPSGKRFKQGQARSAAVVSLLATDSDCRVRRAGAGLPAPDPRATCMSQTPAEVFPGRND